MIRSKALRCVLLFLAGFALARAVLEPRSRWTGGYALVGAECVLLGAL